MEKDTKVADAEQQNKESAEKEKVVDLKIPAQKMLAAMGYTSKKKPEDQKEEPKKEEPKKEEPEKKAEPEKKEPEKKPEANIEEIASRVAAQTAAEMNKLSIKSPQKQEKEEEKDEDELSEKEQEDVEVFDEIERLDPKEYSGIGEKYRKFVKELKKYRASWEKEHEGEKFDKRDDQHSEFFSEHYPDVDESDIIRANRRISEKRVTQKLEPRVNEIERERSTRRAEPFIEQRTKNASAQLAALVSEDAAKAAMGGDTKPFDEAVAKDSVLRDAVKQAKAMIGHVMRQVTLLHEGAGSIEYDKDDPIHREIATKGFAAEQAIQKLPANQQVDDNGRTFVPREQFYRLPKAQREKHWTVDGEIIAALMTNDIVNYTKSIVEETRTKLKELAKEHGIDLEEASKKSQQQQKVVEKRAENTDESKSPSLGDGSRINTTGGKVNIEAGSLADKVLKGLRYRK